MLCLTPMASRYLFKRNRSTMSPKIKVTCTNVFFVMVVLVSHTVALAHAQSVEISKTIKEELLPGAPVADLMTEPAFLEVLEKARNQGNEADVKAGNLHFSILASGNPYAGQFAVDDSSGVVSVKEMINREFVCSFRSTCDLGFEVAARSVLGSFFQLVQFSVSVTDINDNPPEFPEPSFELNVPEESDAGRRFPLPTAFDRDTGPDNGVSEYRILQGPPMFRLIEEVTERNATALFLSLDSVLNREASESYKVLVGAVDGGIPPLTGTLTVAVQIADINDNFPVFEQSVYTKTIPEDFGRDHPVQTVSATDADTGRNGELVYSFSAQQPLDNLHFFRIDAKTGSIYLTRSIESRTGQMVELVVEARDRGHPPKVTRAKVEIFVEDTVNSMPTIMADALGGAGGVAEVSEFAGSGKVVAHVSVMDPDSGPNGKTECDLDTPEFALVNLGDDGEKFTAVLRTSLDRETKEWYNVTVTCRDHGIPALLAKERFSVRVMDENDEDPVFDPRAYEVDILENNTIGAVITQLYATDADIGENAWLTFEVAGINEKYFSVDPQGLMTALVPLDREESGKIVATVIARDGGEPPRAATATVVVNLQDVNDMRPEFDSDVFEFRVEEGQPPGKFVGIVSASDHDLGANREVFYLFPVEYLSGTGRVLFQVDPDEGIVTTGAMLDREDVAVHKLLVLAVDRGNPPLTGTATIVVKVLDVNDNDPVFEVPMVSNNMPGVEGTWENESVSIPHTWDPAEPVANVIARDADEGLNARIVYTLNRVNESAPFSMNPDTGVITLDEELSPDDVGIYIFTVAATDQGPRHQRATVAPLFIDVYFDNSTLLIGGAGRGGEASQAVVLGLVAAGLVLVLVALLIVVIVCVRRNRARSKLHGGVPNSASTSSTAKLQGGYYIAPGVRGSSDSILAGKHNDQRGKYNSAATRSGDLSADEDDPDGMRTANPYVVMLPRRTDSNLPSEIIEISRTNGQVPAMNDPSQNPAETDNAEDSTMFSTFKSEEDILSPGLRNGSLRRQSNDTNSIAKRSAGANDTFDEMSNEDSTSDSGRGGSEVDIRNGAAAAAASKEKARAKAATPVSLKSGISNRLSPLPRDAGNGPRAFTTFRGGSPSSFRFDSDSDTLTRRRDRVPSSPGFPSSPAYFNRDDDSDTMIAPHTRRFDFSTPTTRLSESDGTDSELGAMATGAMPRGRFHNLRRPLFQGTSTPHTAAPQYPNPQHVAGIYSPNVPGASHMNGYNGGGEGGGGRLPSRVPPLLPPISIQPSHQRPDSESDAQLSDSSSSTNPTGRPLRNSHVPRLPYYPGVEFSHHAYGGSNRNSISAFSHNSTATNSEPPYQYYQNNINNPNSSAYNANSATTDYQPSGRVSSASSSSQGTQGPDSNEGPDPRVSMNYGNVVSELQESRPVSMMEEDFLLPPYPEVENTEVEEDKDIDDQLNVHSGYTGFSPHRDDERAALFESSA